MAKIDRMSRRNFLRYSAAAGAVASAAGPLAIACTSTPAAPAAVGADASDDFRWSEASIVDLQAAMESGETTALELVRDHIARIERLDWSALLPLNSVLELNPDAEAIARDLDDERKAGRVRGPLHGIPIMLKDTIATADRMETTAGSLALLGAKAPRDSGVAKSLRDAGAVLLGKNNLSEWNAFRGYPTRGGWSARAGVGRNPYALAYSTGDSSSGSAAAVAASFAVGAVGMETYGSIVMPSSLCGIVGLKPTTGLTSRSGTIPISFSRDVTGPMARTVEDVATLLGGLVGVDPHDDATAKSAGHFHRDYRRFLDPDGLRGARIGIWRGYDNFSRSDPTNVIVEELIGRLPDLGATVVDPADIPHAFDITGYHTSVMMWEFKEGIARYLAGLTNTEMRSLTDIIAFNHEHADEELRWHDQGLFDYADTLSTKHPDYRTDFRTSLRLGRQGFAAVMDKHRLDALFAPTFVPAWSIDLVTGDITSVGNGCAGPSNAAGYPHITVPAGYVGELPIGVSFMARAWEEPKLFRYAYAFEQAVQARHAPRFLADYGVLDFIPGGARRRSSWR